MSPERNFEYQYEHLDAYRYFSEFDEISQTKCKALSLRENKSFWKNELTASCNCFAEFTRNSI